MEPFQRPYKIAIESKFAAGARSWENNLKALKAIFENENARQEYSFNT